MLSKQPKKNSGNTQSAKIAGKNDATWVFLALGKKMTTEELTKTFQMYNPVTGQSENHTHVAKDADVALLTQMSKYDEYIKEAVSVFKEWGITVSMIKGYISIESQAQAEVNKNGLMQIMLATWDDIVKKRNLTSPNKKATVDMSRYEIGSHSQTAQDPKLNIFVGTAVLADKINSAQNVIRKNTTDNPDDIVKLCYNAGQGTINMAGGNMTKK